MLSFSQYANSALSQLRADDVAPQASAAFGGRDVQLNNVNLRFDALRMGVRRLSLAGLNVGTASGVLPVGSLWEAANAEDSDLNSFDQRRAGFITGQFARTDEAKGDGAPVFNGHGYGLTAGVDYRINSSWVLGTALGYDTSNSDLLLNRGSVNSKQLTGTFYASWVSRKDYYAEARPVWSRSPESRSLQPRRSL